MDIYFFCQVGNGIYRKSLRTFSSPEALSNYLRELIRKQQGENSSDYTPSYYSRFFTVYKLQLDGHEDPVRVKTKDLEELLKEFD